MFIVFGLAVILIFAVLAILVEPTGAIARSHDPRTNLPIWALRSAGARPPAYQSPAGTAPRRVRQRPCRPVRLQAGDPVGPDVRPVARPGRELEPIAGRERDPLARAG